jgi:hypothetical protein
MDLLVQGIHRYLQHLQGLAIWQIARLQKRGRFESWMWSRSVKVALREHVFFSMFAFFQVGRLEQPHETQAFRASSCWEMVAS